MRDEFGPGAVVVSVEKVTVGGIAGFLARQHYEVMVDAPDAPDAPSTASPGEAHLLDVPARLGIAALLAEADDEEVRLSGMPKTIAAPTPLPVVSTASATFDDLMRSLALDEPASPSPVAPPVLSSNPGDLVVLVGVRRDALVVAQSVAAASGVTVRIGGSLSDSDYLRVDNRRDALEARAQGVREGCAVVIALAVAPGRPDTTADIVRILAPDQVWIVVDASRKFDDTSAWVAPIGAVVPLDAMAVLGRDDTATPDSVDALGIPVVWEEGTPMSSVLRTGSARR